MKLNKSLIIVSGLALLLGAGCFGTPAKKAVTNSEVKPTAEAPKGVPPAPAIPASTSTIKETGTNDLKASDEKPADYPLPGKNEIPDGGPKAALLDPKVAIPPPIKDERTGPPVEQREILK